MESLDLIINKKLYLVYDNRSKSHQDFPFAFILSDNEDLAKEKALHVFREQWEKQKITHERFYKENLYCGKRKVPDYEKQYGPKPNKIEDVCLSEVKEDFYIL